MNKSANSIKQITQEKDNAVQIENPVTIMDQGDLLIVRIVKPVLVPIVRTVQEEEKIGKEPFSNVVMRAQRLGNFDTCINGIWYGLDRINMGPLLYGNPISAGVIENEGEALLANGSRHGRPSPKLCYAAQRHDLSVEFACGASDTNVNIPSSGFRTGIGGLCPLIINGLKYGVENIYNESSKEVTIKRDASGSCIEPPGSDTPCVGSPKEEYKKFLIQRSNNKYIGMQARNPHSGKAGFGITQDGMLYVIVQPDGTGSMSFENFRDEFVKRDCSNAVSVDGSDSVFMYRKNTWNSSPVFVTKAVPRKDLTMSVGLGFKSALGEVFAKQERVKEMIKKEEEAKKAKKEEK